MHQTSLLSHIERERERDMGELDKQESFPMTGGDGPYSYSKNSNPQKEAADRAKAMLVATIGENIDMEHSSPSSNSFRIADLGCSVGPNTFTAVNNIIEAIEQKHKEEGRSSSLLEYQVYFSDHASNDFNTLFINLPSNRQYFAAGVPGSFHGRLFPKASLNFVYSSYALQWLSNTPCNKGRIHYANAPKEVGEAYAAQYEKDMRSFLDARAQELVLGGLMALLIPARPNGTLPGESSLGPLFHPLESSLVDMAHEGILSKAMLDSFNLPIYSPSSEELQKLIRRNGYFRTVRMEEMHQEFSLFFSMQVCRAGLEGITTRHFGGEIVDELFNRYAKKIEDRPKLCTADGLGCGLFILLKRI